LRGLGLGIPFISPESTVTLSHIKNTFVGCFR